MAYTFTCLATIENVAPDEVFNLRLDVELHVQSMARSRERVLEAPPGKLLGVGDRVTWSARHCGLPRRMTSEVTEWDRPTRFVDEQVSGPFQSLRHEHRFRADDGGAVEMVDVITMSAPLGLLGRLVEHVELGRYMERLIKHRAEVIKAHAQGEGRFGRSCGSGRSLGVAGRTHGTGGVQRQPAREFPGQCDHLVMCRQLVGLDVDVVGIVAWTAPMQVHVSNTTAATVVSGMCDAGHGQAAATTQAGRPARVRQAGRAGVAPAAAALPCVGVPDGVVDRTRGHDRGRQPRDHRPGRPLGVRADRPSRPLGGRGRR